MCTVSFLARKSGYVLAMNRDEKLSRPAGLPASEKVIDGCSVLGPSELGGGTWIALNGFGVTYALINWYAIAKRVKVLPVSRGKVVTAVSPVKAPAVAATLLGRLPLARINPFRLIGIFPATREIAEWDWDLKKMVQKKHPWAAQQWISSGFDEPTAQRIRARTFQQKLKLKSAGSLDWLRRLHGSHLPSIGPFSTCMHRVDAATVSYTEVAVAQKTAALRYFAGAPCQGIGGHLQSGELTLA
jgi:hypothetical protein